MGAEMTPGAHRRELVEAVVCMEKRFCIQERASGGCCERKQPLAHTRGSAGWLWAAEGAGRVRKLPFIVTKGGRTMSGRGSFMQFGTELAISRASGDKPTQ